MSVPESVQAVLLATDESGKLRPLSDAIPAPLLPLANQPVMAHAVALLARHGLRRAQVCVQRQAGRIEAYFGRGRRWNVALEYVLLRDARGTAGALKWAESVLTDTFLVLPADVLIDCDLTAVVAAHRARGSAATIVTMRETTGAPRPTGIYVFEPRVLRLAPAGATWDIAGQLIPALRRAQEPVHHVEVAGYYNDLATFAAYQTAQEAYLRRAADEANSEEEPAAVKGRQIAPGIWIGRHCVIHPSVRLAAPLCIGDNCQIGREAELGPGTVIGPHVVIDEGAAVSHSTVLANTYVGRLVDVARRVVNGRQVIDVATGESVEVVDDFLLSTVETAVLRRTAERIFGATIAFTCLALLLPLLLLLGVATWLTTGRLFTRETRVSAGRPVSLLRLATRRRDGRVTALGELLRRLEWDRLPQLGQVITGELALVGVKPLTPEEVAQRNEPWQQQRHEQVAGFTGLWYVQTNVNATLDDVLISDVYYAATRNWRDDLRLLWRTPQAWRRRLEEAEHRPQVISVGN